MATPVTPRRRPAVVAATAILALLVAAGCALDGRQSSVAGESTRPSSGNGSADAAPPSTGALQEEAVRIRLSIGDGEAIGTLEESPVTRDLVSMLPVTVPMSDLFGREKPGPLPRALTTGTVEPVFTYRVGQIAYWPPSHDIFVVYEGDGLRVPSPGLIPLGTVETGLDVVAAAGDDFDMTITVLD